VRFFFQLILFKLGVGSTVQVGEVADIQFRVKRV
jgi:hypothetical protein